MNDKNLPSRNYDIKGFLLPFYYYFVVFSNCFAASTSIICWQKVVICEVKTPWCKKKGEAKKNQRLKALISTKGKKFVNETAT